MDQNNNYNPQQQYQQQQYQPQQQQYQPQQQQYQQQYQPQYQQQYQQAPKLKGATMLKVVGILMIIGAAIGIIATIIGITGIAALASNPYFSFGASYLGISTGVLYAAFALSGVGSIVQLIAGISGIKHNNNKAKAGKLLIWGIAVAAISVLSSILTAVGGYPFPVLSLLLGLVIPILYIIGAVQNKNS